MTDLQRDAGVSISIHIRMNATLVLQDLTGRISLDEFRMIANSKPPQPPDDDG